MTRNGRPAVGIDLGTTFTVVAHVDDVGRPCTVPNADGDALTPSVVFFDESSIVVGKEALKAGSIEPDRVFQFVKREMGSPVCSKAVGGEFFPPEVVQSLLLEKVRRDAEAKIGPIKDVVITVPAYFNEPRRKATQDAGRLAGLNVIDIINEPTAAAIAFGVREGFLSAHGESRRTETVLVFDLGGGTFDVTLMQIDGKNYSVVATDGNFKLGGIDWDQRLVDFLAQEFMAKHKIDLRTDPVGQHRLLREADEAKRALSGRERITISFEQGGQGIRLPLARLEYESMTADLLERTRFTVSNMLKQAGVRWEQITRLLLVGGSTRMPMVVEMLRRESGKEPDRSLAADEAVANGAAVYAGLLLSRKNSDHQAVEVTNVNSHSLGVLGIDPTTKRPANKVMIPRNTSLPATTTSQFRTRSDGQKSILVEVIEGGDASGNHSTPIGRCVIRDLPPGLAAGTDVDVTFCYAANGRLSVHARIPRFDREARSEIDRSSGLSEGKLDEWSSRLRNGLRPLNLDR